MPEPPTSEAKNMSALGVDGDATCETPSSIVDCDSQVSAEVTRVKCSALTTENTEDEHTSSTHFIPSSPPKKVTMEQLSEVASNFFKMSLAHEITLDSDFKLERPDASENSIHNKVKETIHKAFWDILRESLNADPPFYGPAIHLLREIKEWLLNLVLPRQESLRALIEATLDVESAEETLKETGKLNLEAYVTPVLDLLASMCAPARDADISRLRDIDDAVELFSRVFDILSLMHMDMANFTIVQMRPYIREQSVTYERKKFEQLIELQKKVGIDALLRTRAWLRAAFDRLTEPQDSTPAAILPSPNNILGEAYLALLTWSRDSDLPETVLIDQVRILEIAECLRRTVTLASILLVVCSCAASEFTALSAGGPAHLSTLSPVGLTALKTDIINDTKGIFASSASGTITQLIDPIVVRMLYLTSCWRQSLLSTDGQDITDDCSSIIKLPDTLRSQIVIQVASIMKANHPVYSLMLSRALGFLRSMLSSPSPSPLSLPTGFGALSEGPQEKPSGGGPFTGQASRSPQDLGPSQSQTYDLALIARRFLAITAHNRHVFGPFYAEIIQHLLRPRETGDQAPSTST